MKSAPSKTPSPTYSIRKASELAANPKNARTHSPKQIKKIAESIKKFGFMNPVIADKKGVLVAGHGRLAAAQMIGLDEIPCIDAEHLSAKEKRAYMLADNRIAMDAEWDDEILRVELDYLMGDFDVSLTGFDESEISGFLESDVEPIEGEDDVPTIPKTPYSKLGQIYQLGEHRLMCGDSTKKEAVELLMGGERADMVFTDPPYGISVVSKDGSVGGGTKGKYREVIGDDNTSAAEKSYEICCKMGIEQHFFWGANHYSGIFPSSPCWIVWDKQGGKSVTFADCELCYTNLKKPVRMFTHIWDGFRRDSEKGDNRVHPTQKPVQLIVDIFKKFNCPEKCLGLFGGSGSTLIACEKTQRKCFMMELDPHYVDVIIARWEKFTGEKAVLLND